MPLYEYRCPHCEITFDMLRPFSKADAPATCPQCKGDDTKRCVSRVAFIRRNSDGSASASSGGGHNCAGCSLGSCAGCRH